jgi:hypothetical protein
MQLFIFRQFVLCQSFWSITLLYDQFLSRGLHINYTCFQFDQLRERKYRMKNEVKNKSKKKEKRDENKERRGKEENQNKERKRRYQGKETKER